MTEQTPETTEPDPDVTEVDPAAALREARSNAQTFIDRIDRQIGTIDGTTPAAPSMVEMDLRSLLREALGDQLTVPCSYDPSGVCTSHGYSTTENGCVIPRVAQALARAPE